MGSGAGLRGYLAGLELKGVGIGLGLRGWDGGMRGWDWAGVKGLGCGPEGWIGIGLSRG